VLQRTPYSHTGQANEQDNFKGMDAGFPLLSTLFLWQEGDWSAPLLQVAHLTGTATIVEIAAVGAMAAGLALTLINLNKSRRQLIATQRRMGELEYQLNEVEAALYSESQVLLVWRGQELQPHRMAGEMHGSADIPSTLETVADFAAWLEADSVAELTLNLDALRSSGRAFNVGVKSKRGELLEVDGRPAGAHVTLRFRPLAGDRRQMTELSYDASKLAKQVQRLSAIMDAAPFAAWITGEDQKLVWVNQAYVHLVEASDMQTVLRNGTLLFSREQLDTSKANPATMLQGRGRAITKGTMRGYNVHESAIDGGMVGYAVDITSLEEAERELERHIKAHASTLDKLETAIAIFGPDQRLRFFNQAYVKKTGSKPSRLTAKFSTVCGPSVTCLNRQISASGNQSSCHPTPPWRCVRPIGICLTVGRFT
jgi:PAS domain-containing protein